MWTRQASYGYRSYLDQRDQKARRLVYDMYKFVWLYTKTVCSKEQARKVSSDWFDREQNENQCETPTKHDWASRLTWYLGCNFVNDAHWTRVRNHVFSDSLDSFLASGERFAGKVSVVLSRKCELWIVHAEASWNTSSLDRQITESPVYWMQAQYGSYRLA